MARHDRKDETMKLPWLWRPRDSETYVSWSMIFGTPHVTLDFHVPEDDERGNAGRAIQVRYSLDEACRVAHEMWQTANRVRAEHRRVDHQQKGDQLAS